MTTTIHGFVTRVTRQIKGTIEIEFFDFEKNEIATFSSNPNTKEGLPEPIAFAPADSLAHNVWVKIEAEN
ncbi:MAG: hypothetical protein ACYC7D_02345 [Nitrososphaerales archaeon]